MNSKSEKKKKKTRLTQKSQFQTKNHIIFYSSSTSLARRYLYRTWAVPTSSSTASFHLHRPSSSDLFSFTVSVRVIIFTTPFWVLHTCPNHEMKIIGFPYGLHGASILPSYKIFSVLCCVILKSNILKILSFFYYFLYRSAEYGFNMYMLNTIKLPLKTKKKKIVK